MKKLICMNIMQVAVIFFFLCFGQKTGGTIPVQVKGLLGARHYINPLPHGLMLTGYCSVSRYNRCRPCSSHKDKREIRIS